MPRKTRGEPDSQTVFPDTWKDARARVTPATSDMQESRIMNSEIRDLVARSGTSFFWGMRMLPRPQRQAMYAIYAFCRVVDDIADSPGRIEDKRNALDEWRREIDRLYRGVPSHIIARPLLLPVERYQLPQEEFHAIVDGCETDAAETVSIETRDQLLVYARRVAGAVGILSIHVFGASEPPGYRYATSLGTAFQLTNILRDIREDAARGRMYLPATSLRRHGVPDAPAATVVGHEGFAGAFDEIVSLAFEYFDESDGLLECLPRKKLRPAIIMRAVYRETLDRLHENGWPGHEPVRLSAHRKLWLGIRHGLLTG